MKRERTLETSIRRYGAAPAPRALTDAELNAVSGGRDASSGMAVGRRTWKPIRIMTPVQSAP